MAAPPSPFLNSSTEVQTPTGLGSYQRTNINDQFHNFKADFTKRTLSFLYHIGLGYTSAKESFDEHNDKLFREILADAESVQRHDKNLLYRWVMLGDFDELVKRLDAIESDTSIPKKKSQIYAHDVAGANIVHLAYLFKQYHIGHYLVERYPELASQPYKSTFDDESEQYIHTKAGDECKEKLRQLQQKSILNPISKLSLSSYSALAAFASKELLNERMPYAGENILHMVIVRRDYEEVRWLLNFYRDHKHSCPYGLSRLLNSNANGKFFDTTGDLNFGGYPLQFAVCSNDPKIFDLVYSFAATMDEEDLEHAAGQQGNGGDTTMSQQHSATGVGAPSSAPSSSRLAGPHVLFETDREGNNVLHLCVQHSLQNMYEHVYITALGVMTRELKHAYAECLKEQPRIGDEMRSLKSADEEYNEYTTGYRMLEKTLRVPEQIKLDEWAAAEARVKVDERLQLALNENFHSPLTLAAAIIKKDQDSEQKTEKKVKMFEYLLTKLKKVVWSYGPVSMATLDLDGVEIKYRVLDRYDIKPERVFNLKQSKEMHAAIDWLCINDADKAIQIPEVTKLIQTKWERVGYPFFVLSFLVHMILAILTTFILLFVNATPSSQPGYATEYIVNVLYAVVVLIYFIMFLQELFNSIMFGAHGFALRGVAKFDKFLRLVKILAFVVFCCYKTVTAYRQKEHTRYSNTSSGATVLYYQSDDFGIKISLTICIIASWIHMYYYFMGFDSTGPFMLTIFRIISKDVPFFMQFYGIVVFAFACALSLLANSGDYKAAYGIRHLLQAVWTLIQDTVDLDATNDNINQPLHYPEYLRWPADILLTIYYMIVIILMLNLLIAMISDTYAQYSSYNDAILLIAKYNIMNAMEKIMWDDEQRDNRAKYAMVHDVFLSTRSHYSPPPPNLSLYKRFSIWLGMQSRSTVVPFSASNSSSSSGGDGQQAAASEIADSATSSQRAVVPAHAKLGPNQRVTISGKHIAKKVKITTYTFELEITQNEWWDIHQINLDNSAKSKVRTQTSLFIIDPQNDFHPGGSLAVPTANADAQRIADMIDKFGDHIHDIFVSMDSHYPCHIAHAVSWVNAAGEHPEPFTVITNKDVISGKWIHVEALKEATKRHTILASKNAESGKAAPTAGDAVNDGAESRLPSVADIAVAAAAAASVLSPVAKGSGDVGWDMDMEGHKQRRLSRIAESQFGKKMSMAEWSVYYTGMLERKSKMSLVIWPEHCIIGSKGHSVSPVINDALQRWAERSKRPVTYVMKGQNLRTEMYSALMAEVEDPTDPNTALNTDLISMLTISDRVLICGQAMSHCVNYTTRDLINHWTKDTSKLVLLTDAASPVPSFEREAADFVEFCEHKGVTCTTTTGAFSGYTARELPPAASASASTRPSSTTSRNGDIDPTAAPAASFSLPAVRGESREKGESGGNETGTSTGTGTVGGGGDRRSRIVRKASISSSAAASETKKKKSNNSRNSGSSNESKSAPATPAPAPARSSALAAGDGRTQVRPFALLNDDDEGEEEDQQGEDQQGEDDGVPILESPVAPPDLKRGSKK